MENGINTRQDGPGYDLVPYQPDRILDANNLYDAWKAAQRNSAWKPKVQQFEMNWLWNIGKLQDEIATRTYKPQRPTEFIIRERGKPRVIHGNQIRDRVVEHCLNDEVVIPSIQKYLIYDNGASLKDRGVDFTRRRVVEHLRSFYGKYGNDGYVLLIDFSKYYDNIRHDVIRSQFHKYVTDETALWLLDIIIQQFRIDVSYMTDDEYAVCLNTLFNSLEYSKIDKSLLIGEKWMDKHMDIGNQTSQSAGIMFPTPLDNYIKIVCGEKYYDRYMDDALILHQSKEHLVKLKADIIQRAREQGIFVNENKTRIVKISDTWRFLQIQYSLTDTGRIIRKINPKTVTQMRRRMKKLAHTMTDKEFRVYCHGWVRSNRKYMSRQQYTNINVLYNDLRKRTKDYVPNNAYIRL